MKGPLFTWIWYEQDPENKRRCIKHEREYYEPIEDEL